MEQRFNERRSKTRTRNVVKMDEIVNKVATSVLQVFDLEDYYPEGKRVAVDMSQWLEDGFLLREKSFREQLKTHDWSQYQNSFAAIFCSTDAIVPAWASILVTVHLSPFAKKVVIGTLEDLETSLYNDLLPQIDFGIYGDKPVILKGCSHKPVPMSAYIYAIQMLQQHAKSIMYGEACSAVPLFKRK